MIQDDTLIDPKSNLGTSFNIHAPTSLIILILELMLSLRIFPLLGDNTIFSGGGGGGRSCRLCGILGQPRGRWMG